MTIRSLISHDELKAAFEVMIELRPGLRDEEDFLARVQRQRLQGYRLTGVAVGGRLVCVAGWREMEMLATGPHLYVEDLVTIQSERSKGYGKALLEHLRELAKARGLAGLVLNTGLQRGDAQRFYLREGMQAVSYQFAHAF